MTDVVALLRILAGCAKRGGRIPAVVFDRRATKHPAKIRAALRVGAAPAPRRVAGSLYRSSAIRLASALPVIRRRSQRCYTNLRLGALVGVRLFSKSLTSPVDLQLGYQRWKICWRKL